MKQVRVRLARNPYTVYCGAGVINETGNILKGKIEGKSVVIVSNAKVYGLYGKQLEKSIKKAGFTSSLFLMGDGEKYKTIQSVEKICGFCARAGLDRYGAVIALGGGVTGDTAGFAAGVYMRGVPVVQVPTTLLAQVDSSVGGKTGVDLKEGKNLAGVFHQPLFVAADSTVLRTLPEREFLSGLAESIKHGFIMDRALYEFTGINRTKILGRDPGILSSLVAMNAADKASIVERDELETTGLRAILNYGHTIGHAIESAMNYRGIMHGEAVAAGMAMAAGLSYRLGVCPRADYEAQIKMLKSFNLIKPLRKIKKSLILKRMLNDKKMKNGKIRFILTKKIGCATLIENIENTAIKRELDIFLSP